MKLCTFIIILITLPFSNHIMSQTTKIKSESVLVDQSGNTYKTVKIGNQVWMAENLRAKNYLNGDAIEEVQYKDVNLREKYKDPIFCILKNGNYFYSWKTVVDNRRIAPIGWHVPTKADWEELLSFSKNVNDFKSISGWPELERFYPDVECPNCENWNSEYRSKVACNRCKDTRKIKSRKSLINPSLNGTNRLNFNIKHVGMLTQNWSLHETHLGDGFWANDFYSYEINTGRKIVAYWLFIRLIGGEMPEITNNVSDDHLLPLRLIKNKE
jgi:uncharacterized protein (TIGR02145 family)